MGKPPGRTLPNILNTEDAEALSLDLDTEALRERGILDAIGEQRLEGAVDLERPRGINFDGAWTEGRRPRGRIRGSYALIPRDLKPYFRALFAGHSAKGQRRIWASMFDLYSRARLSVVEVRSSRYRGSWLGVFQSGDLALGAERLLTLVCSDTANGMSYDFMEGGIGEFELVFHGAFPTLESLLAYREYLMNVRLDEGWRCYNMAEIESGAVKRFVRVEVNQKTVERLVRACAARGTRLTTVVHQLVLSWLRKGGADAL